MENEWPTLQFRCKTGSMKIKFTNTNEHMNKLSEMLSLDREMSERKYEYKFQQVSHIG